MQTHQSRMLKTAHPKAVSSRRKANMAYQSTTQSDHERTVQGAWLLYLFLVAVAGVALIGVWLSLGVIQRYGGATEHAAQHGGATASVPGGLLQVDRVIPEHMAPMHAGKFASTGMSMSSMGIDMAPEGFRRFTVEITLVGQASSGLRYAAEHFWVVGDGVAVTTPLRHHLGNGVVPDGSVMSGVLTFEVPATARTLELHFKGADHPIMIDLDPATATHHETNSDQQDTHADENQP